MRAACDSQRTPWPASASSVAAVPMPRPAKRGEVGIARAGIARSVFVVLVVGRGLFEHSLKLFRTAFPMLMNDAGDEEGAQYGSEPLRSRREPGRISP